MTNTLRKFKIVYKDRYNTEHDLTVDGLNVRQIMNDIEYSQGVSPEDVVSIDEVIV